MIDEAYICEKITALRMEKGVSARDMSLSLGQNPGYINRIENKKSLPSMEMFLYICDYLNISPKDFFDDERFCSAEYTKRNVRRWSRSVW